jgi:pyruvate/2-oxoacid:ferredoxin oxidoreductase beta subunit
MSRRFLSTDRLPFCRGCGHAMVAQSIEKALQTLPLDPLDVVVVTDIGCIGIIDRQFDTHTVHGLHGRSVALATGISMGMADPSKKIIVFIGDGGATIGLQHLAEAAHRNVDMTVLVHNNMLYGMTGGQPSGLTPCGFRTSTMPAGKPDRGMDLCRLVHGMGAPYARRMLAMGDMSVELAEAFSVRGFSMVEAIELCPSYGVKFNPDRRLAELAESAGLGPVLLTNTDAVPGRIERRDGLPSLLDAAAPLPLRHGTAFRGRFSVFLSGSAGEGVQSTAEMLAQAAIACGLHATKKGSYPVTVGVGFSTSEVIISSMEINYTGIPAPDAVAATSEDGLGKVRGLIGSMERGEVLLDSSLQAPTTRAEVVSEGYRTYMGPRNAVLVAVVHLLRRHPVIPVEAFMEEVAGSRAGASIDLEKLGRSFET